METEYLWWSLLLKSFVSGKKTGQHKKKEKKTHWANLCPPCVPLRRWNDWSGRKLWRWTPRREVESERLIQALSSPATADGMAACHRDWMHGERSSVLWSTGAGMQTGEADIFRERASGNTLRLLRPQPLSRSPSLATAQPFLEQTQTGYTIGSKSE